MGARYPQSRAKSSQVAVSAFSPSASVSFSTTKCKGGRSALMKLICRAAWLIQRTTGARTTDHGPQDHRHLAECGMGIKGEAGLSPRSPRQTSWLQFLSSLRPLRLCVRKARSLAKIAKTNLLASVSFFFAPFAALREEGPVSRQDRKDRQEKPLLFSSASLPHQPARAISQCGTTHCPTPCHASEQVADCRAVEKGT